MRLLQRGVGTFPIDIPPLAQRLEDIPFLTEHFYHDYVRRHVIANPPRLTRLLLVELAARPWSDNVRELHCVLERALLKTAAAGLPELRLTERDRHVEHMGKTLKRGSPKLALAEESATRQALQSCGGKVYGKNGAAALLGISPSTVRSRMKILGLLS